MQHLAMKEALARAIDAVPGWHAVIEHPHESRDWIVDVLAESDTAVKRRVAFEVQLSPQSHDRYFERSSRYFVSGIFPVWVIPRPLEKHSIKVPTVVTWFGKDAPVPDDLGELLLRGADHNGVAHAPERVRLDHFVASLLTKGPAWTHGTPSEQDARKAAEARLRAERDRAEARARTERLQTVGSALRAAPQQSKDERTAMIQTMNRSCAAPASVYGPLTVPVRPSSSPPSQTAAAARAGCSSGGRAARDGASSGPRRLALRI
ncbi:competence protein CoiA family protein [Sinomonas sp. RB5]